MPPTLAGETVTRRGRELLTDRVRGDQTEYRSVDHMAVNVLEARELGLSVPMAAQAD